MEEKTPKKVYKLSEHALANKRKYTKEWQKKHNKVFVFQLNIEKDKKIIDLLKSQKNKNDFIKKLLKKEIVE